MNILVCGAAGYIGSHVLNILRAQKHQCLALDNFSRVRGMTCFCNRAWRGLGKCTRQAGGNGEGISHHSALVGQGGVLACDIGFV